MSSGLRATGFSPSVTDWGGGMSASCKPGVQLFVRGQWMATYSALQYHATSETVKGLSATSSSHVRSARLYWTLPLPLIFDKPT